MGPELEKAMELTHEIKRAAPDQPVILTVHRRLARNAAELMTLSAALQGRRGLGCYLLAPLPAAALVASRRPSANFRCEISICSAKS